MSNDIDPVEYGKLLAKVENLESSVEKLAKKIDDLMEVANKSKGGLWVLMAVGGAVGGFLTWMAEHFFGGK
jgi:hypothetical protein